MCLRHRWKKMADGDGRMPQSDMHPAPIAGLLVLEMQPMEEAAEQPVSTESPVVAASAQWTFHETRDLIRLVSENGEIWDSRLPEHSNIADIQRAWGRIAYQNGKSTLENKNRWKYLRNYFLRLVRRMGGAKGEKGPRTPKWEHWDDFAFMVPADISNLPHEPTSMKRKRTSASDEDEEISNSGSDAHRQTGDPMMMPPALPMPEMIATMPPQMHHAMPPPQMFLRMGLASIRRFSSALPPMAIGQVRETLQRHVSALQNPAALTAKVPAYSALGHSVDVGRDKVIIPLKSKPEIRLYYTNYKLFARLGMILEDLDTFAVWIAYKHNQAMSVPMGTPAHEPMCIVTACVDKIDFHDQDIQSDQDIEMHGHVSWVGRSSIEVTMTLKQKPYDFHEPISLLTAKFVMVSRSPSFQQSVANVPLALESAADREMFQAGLEAVQRRKHFERNSLLAKPPSEQERFILHDIFLKTIDQKHSSLRQRVLPEGHVWLEDCKLKNSIICFPVKRNLYGKIFGGYLMRQAFEAAWANAAIFSNGRPRLRSLDDVMFRKSVEVGRLLLLSSQNYLNEELLRMGNVLWNAINAAGSALLLLCLLPEFLSSLLFSGLYGSICDSGTLYSGRWSGWAMHIFVLSKVWELGDTVWLVLRRRPVPFLHAFHHTVVLLQVWISYRSTGAVARWGVVMNLALHTLMYSYFVAQSLSPTVRRMAPFITAAQITQFGTGCTILLRALQYSWRGVKCDTGTQELYFHLFLHVAFLYLFVGFFKKNYTGRRDLCSLRRVCYSIDRSIQISVNAEVLDVESGESETTNTFQFTFTADNDVPTVLPKSYADGMLYLEAKRHFELNKW
ncbi:hypothetical protein QR680_017116 [Steinernema hermaphroditum]|uniref:Very-long-chain 3-oxoacyl-CoA synthase n=1 Tax=Steinernema hermaphroditum TaxID=289476 RepID=A0AA39LN28_9BILA|nr:hypothetical protein QR680_017116 [Steinernema hermaphroditum]